MGRSGQTLPVIIETGSLQSELTLSNFSASDKQVDFSFVADAVETSDDIAAFSLRLEAGEQSILPNHVSWLRQQGMAGIGPAGRAFVRTLFATAAERNMSGIVIEARTRSPDKRGGQYSLFYNGVPYGSASIESAWIYGLQQNEENRSNLALGKQKQVGHHKPQRLPEPRPDPNILWSVPPGRLGGGPYFHQVTDKEGVVRRSKVYTMGCWTKLLRGIGDPSIGQCTFRS